MKKVIALFLAMVLILSAFAGCSSKKDDNKEQGSTQNWVTDSGDSVSNGSSQNSSTNASSEDKTSSLQSNITSSNQSSKPISSSKPTTSSKPSGSTTTELKMPEALKTLKGIEKYKNERVDYTVGENWLSRPIPTRDVDVFFLYPTGYNGTGDDLSDLNDSSMQGLGNMSLMAQASVFARSCNIYMPKYRQFSINALLKYGNEENLTYCASFDLYSALDYYFQYQNNGRPFILAGHSQGSVWLSVILQDYMKKHPEYLKRMVAAYVIGFSVTKDFLKRNPHLKFATGATDTGVIISYNTEGAGNKNANNMVVEKGAVAINPINWKTDGTPASASQNLGTLDYSTGQMKVPGIADARVDTERGVVICSTVDKSLATPGFGPESYHMHDYSFYYGNLVQNVADRIKAYFEKQQ